MHRTLVLVAALASLALAGCAASVLSPVGMGAFFTDVRGPVAATDVGSSAKAGRACAHNILGLAAYGDASIAAAKKEGGIAQVASVDHHSLSILSAYSRFCTHVRGE